MLISSRMFPSKILCLTENRCFIGAFRRKLSLFLFYGRNFVFVEWNEDSFLQDTWEIKTFRFANSKTGFLLSKSFPWHGKQSLQEIWAAATASLSDLLLFISSKLTQNPTSSGQLFFSTIWTLCHVPLQPGQWLAGLSLCVEITWPRAQQNRLYLP